jgi:hypothetical protein
MLAHGDCQNGPLSHLDKCVGYRAANMVADAAMGMGADDDCVSIDRLGPLSDRLWNGAGLQIGCEGGMG